MFYTWDDERLTEHASGADHFQDMFCDSERNAKGRWETGKGVRNRRAWMLDIGSGRMTFSTNVIASQRRAQQDLNTAHRHVFPRSAASDSPVRMRIVQWSKGVA